METCQYLCLPESLDAAQDCLVLDLEQLVKPNVDWKYHQIIDGKQHGRSNYHHEEHLLFLDFKCVSKFFSIFIFRNASPA